jgi:hypothetical protein
MAPTRPRAILIAGILVWIAASGAWTVPGILEEIGEKRYLARIAREHPPMIRTECHRARGVENQDFIREDAHPDRCWVDLPSFRRLYPEMARVTDEGASARILAYPDLPLGNWDGSPAEAVVRALAVAFAPPIAALFLVALLRRRRAGRPS